MPEVVLEFEYGKRGFQKMDRDGMLEHVEMEAAYPGKFRVPVGEVFEARFPERFPGFREEQRIPVLLREFPQVLVQERRPLAIEPHGGIEASFQSSHVYFARFPVVIFPLDESDFADSEPAVVREVEYRQVPEPKRIGILRVLYAFEKPVQLLLREELDFVLLFSRHIFSVLGIKKGTT